VIIGNFPLARPVREGTNILHMRSQPPEKPRVIPGKTGAPDWADGLRQLYDAVVDEPLPDSFKDLLTKLDQPVKGPPPEGGSSAQ
jgi:Anti-sigma factor NepR